MDTTITHSGNDSAKKEIIQVTIILSVLTIVEIALGLWMIHVSDTVKWFIKGVIVILMLVKAFYIVAYFMHLKHELKNMILTIVVPLFLFVWFLIAFVYDGNSYKNLRVKYDRYKSESYKEKVGENNNVKETKKPLE